MRAGAVSELGSTCRRRGRSDAQSERVVSSRDLRAAERDLETGVTQHTMLRTVRAARGPKDKLPLPSPVKTPRFWAASSFVDLEDYPTISEDRSGPEAS